MAETSISPDAHVHPQSLVEPGASIGAGTRVWAFAHILAGATIGKDCNICDHTFIEGKVTVGDRVTVKCGVYLWDGVAVEDDVFVGPAAVFTNDGRPRSRQYPSSYPITTLEKGCSIGANATILPGVRVGRYGMVGAGSVVTKNIPAHALVFGNPARIRGYVCRCARQLPGTGSIVSCACGRRFRFASNQSDQECPIEELP